MALDEPRESDDIFDIDGFKYIVDKEFMKRAAPVKVDFIDYGFKLTSSIKFESGCGGCGGSTSCSV